MTAANTGSRLKTTAARLQWSRAGSEAEKQKRYRAQDTGKQQADHKLQVRRNGSSAKHKPAQPSSTVTVANCQKCSVH